MTPEEKPVRTARDITDNGGSGCGPSHHQRAKEKEHGIKHKLLLYIELNAPVFAFVFAL